MTLEAAASTVIAAPRQLRVGGAVKASLGVFIFSHRS
jgi:hypothetical protein